jgi:hypothetical protein
LALYRSLQEHCDDFHLYVIAFDDECRHFLETLHEDRITVIRLSDFEDEALLTVKPDRTRAEYCWTCTPSTVMYVIKKYLLDCCTYLDADLYFFSSPQLLMDELGDCSVMITPHRYTPALDRSAESGKYCVQFITFRNDKRGMEILKWWRNACLEWCFNRIEDGRFGDQKYLDDWTERFEGVKVLDYPGAGVAPWNMQQYEFSIAPDGKLTGLCRDSGRMFDVVFFHFHYMQFLSDRFFILHAYYPRSEEVMRLIFHPYIEKIRKMRRQYAIIRTSEKYLTPWKKFTAVTRALMRRGLREFYCLFILNR